MSISAFELFKIGIGPSSSHTVGPMKAANAFLSLLKKKNLLNPQKISTIKSELFGSLALTGKGHGTDKAVLIGLEGDSPDKVNISSIFPRFRDIVANGSLKLNGDFDVKFNLKRDLLFHKRKILPFHTNGMKFTALGEQGEVLESKNYYSVGGGFFLSEDDVVRERKKSENLKNGVVEEGVKEIVPELEFSTGKEMILQCEKHNISLKELMMINEKTWHSENEINDKLDEVWLVMNNCIKNGLMSEGNLPGPLKVRRRAHTLYSKVIQSDFSLLNYLDYVSSFALSVSEENAAGNRVVTAPTNGAAGVIPAVLKYLKKFHSSQTRPFMHRDFLLIASAIGIIFKKGATISGAEGGCQAEIGTACAMASAGMTYVLGGNIHQISNAANIGCEHNLGLTCDPIFGLVQVPCIERNSMAAIKAINASNLALRGDGQHIISLDRTIRVLKKTGEDMKEAYKETALGGLAWDFYLYDEDGEKRSRLEKIGFTRNMAQC